MRMRLLFFVAFVSVAASSGRPVLTQVTTDAAVAEVRKTLDAARKDVEAYATAGGRAGTPDHPAIKWDATLWAYRERYPATDAAAIGSAEAVRLLVRAELWERAHARIDSLAADDPAWPRVAPVVYSEGIARKDLPYAIDKLSRVASATPSASIKASVLVVVARAYRRQGDKDAAIRTLEAAKAAAPGTLVAEEAEGLLYEITHLSLGLPAPPISGTARNGRAISLAALRGRPVVLVFWAST
jgi:tetratricopeptide (TPR) repeat protein